MSAFHPGGGYNPSGVGYASRPASYSILTLNAWNTEEWEHRREVVVDFFRTYKPDIVTLQEVRPEVLEAVSEGLEDDPAEHLQQNVMEHARTPSMRSIKNERSSSTMRKSTGTSCTDDDNVAGEMSKSCTKRTSTMGTTSAEELSAVEQQQSIRSTGSCIVGSQDFHEPSATKSSSTGGAETSLASPLAAVLGKQKKWRCLEDASCPGLTCEGNIFWNSEVFEEVAFGAEDVDIDEPHRALFWVLLQETNNQYYPTRRRVLVSTCHLTWQGDWRYLALVGGGLSKTTSIPAFGSTSSPAGLTGEQVGDGATSSGTAKNSSSATFSCVYDSQLIDPRKKQMQKVVEVLQRWGSGGGDDEVGDEVAIFFTGDLNCGFAPRAILRSALPYMQDCFAGLQMLPPMTHPAPPVPPEEQMMPQQCLDWIFYDQRWIQPVMASRVSKTYLGRVDPVSDHYPVYFSFQFKRNKDPRRDWMAGDPYFEVLKKYIPTTQNQNENSTDQQQNQGGAGEASEKKPATSSAEDGIDSIQQQVQHGEIV
ncbi:unnamed protein product [Amoebophrya sp. A25]|nr:unnamed protein product [Amoebophrya sp. A25]|eukprot:GSA25T00013723001.1